MSQHGALHGRRRRLLLAALLVGGLVLLGRGFQLQVLQAAEWAGRAERQQREEVRLPAERGTIFDRNGIPLATTREMIRVSTAPREIEDRDAVARTLREVLDLDGRAVSRALDRSRRWVVLPGRYEPTSRASLESIPGVYVERVLERFRPHGDVAVEILGLTSADGRALGGIELVADSLLRGEDGYALARRDAGGTAIPGALMPVEEPRQGHDVYLTLDLGLQEIAEEALRATLREHDAEAGDMIFADPRTGDLLAAVSVRRSGARLWRGVTDPYEPGSTVKPFMMAALLQRGRVSLSDSVYTEDGYYRQGRREIRDVHGYGWLTAGEVLRYSSNIGMVKLAGRLDPEEHYAALRDFGFGTPTGVSYPSESGGRLTRPDAWSGYTQASLAMGYEVSVTPLQMTMAYGALANGGRLLAPRLIREVRSPEGRPVPQGEAREIRRVVDEATAEVVAEVLADVVREGTGQEAGLGTFHVAGKTGTARMFEDGEYRSDAYTASFAGFFPARDPQLVFLVKLDRGSEYGGSVAAPVTRATLAAALAARATPLDRRAVATTVPDAAPVEVTAAGFEMEAWLPPVPGPYVFRTEAGPPRRALSAAGSTPVPDVRGGNARDAAAALHASGFRVRIHGVGRVETVEPAAGTAAARGSVVEVWLGRSR
jgi:cell division protein FtsI (penicillin-binding protein 3)